MFRIISNDFLLIRKYKKFVKDLDNVIENIPRKDYFYKDRIRVASNDLLELLLFSNYNEVNIKEYISKIKASFAYLDFLLDKLFELKYINEFNLCKIGNELAEVYKMSIGWLSNKCK